MSRQRQPSLRLLSLNVNGLRSADKRRTLFSLLHRDRWESTAPSTAALLKAAAECYG